MSKIFGRKFDVYNVSEELIDSSIPTYDSPRIFTNYEDVISAANYIKPYLSSKVIEILKNSKLELKLNILFSEMRINPANALKQTSEVIFPTIRARESYKIDFVNFLGDVLTKSKNRSQEFGLLLPFIFEYFYLLGTSETPKDEFEKRNLAKLMKEAKIFIRKYKKYDKDSEKYELSDFEVIILSMMKRYSSLDASLTLIDMMDYNGKEVLSIINSIASKDEKPEIILEQNGITTYGYKRLRKTISKY